MKSPSTLLAAALLLGCSANAAEDTAMFSNKGGSPDNTGSWLGLGSTFSLIQTPSGAFGIKDSPSSGPIFFQQRWSSWECVGKYSAVSNAVTMSVDKDGTVVDSEGNACFYQRILDPERQFVFQFDCDDWDVLKDKVNYLRPVNDPSKGMFLNSRLNSTLYPQPSSYVCKGPKADYPVGMDTSDATDTYTGGVLEIGSKIGDLAPPIDHESVSFPPNFPDVPSPNLNGLYWNPSLDLMGLFVDDIFLSVHAQNRTFQNVVGRIEGFQETTPGSGSYNADWSKSTIALDGTVVDTSSVCGIIDVQSPFEVAIADNQILRIGDSCPTAGQGVLLLNRQYFLPINGGISVDEAAFSARELDGAKQVPPIDGLATTANFTMAAPNDQGFVLFDLRIEDIRGFAAAHIHAGNATTNGPVVVELTPTINNWPTPIQINDEGLPLFNPSISGTVAFTGAFDESNFQGPLENSTMADFIDSLSNGVDGGEYYVNVHTMMHPDGAIRAQLGSW